MLTPEQMEQAEQRVELFEQLRMELGGAGDLLMLNSELESVPELSYLFALYGTTEAKLPLIGYVPHSAEFVKYSIK